MSDNKDHNRARLDRVKETEVRREEKSLQKMGDLHLNEEGMSRKAQRRFRERVKHYSSKLRRREDKQLSNYDPEG